MGAEYNLRASHNRPPVLKRDPFHSAGQSNSQGWSDSVGEIDIKNGKQSIKGILLGGSEPMAILNGRIVKIGDQIDEFIVTAIDEDGIIISNMEEVMRIPFK